MTSKQNIGVFFSLIALNSTPQNQHSHMHTLVVFFFLETN